MTVAHQDSSHLKRFQARPVWVFATSSTLGRSPSSTRLSEPDNSPGATALLHLSASTTEPALTSPSGRPCARDAARFLSQASFGVTSVDQIEALRGEGFEHWLWSQFSASTLHHTSCLSAQRLRRSPAKVTVEMSFEVIWQHWLQGTDQLRSRVAFALAQITVVPSVAPALGPYALSSCMDLINRNAFGNYRTLLQDMAHHPAMGHYISSLASTKQDPAGALLQLFCIGPVALDLHGSMRFDHAGAPVTAVSQAELKAWSTALSDWSQAMQNPAASARFHAAELALDEVLERSFNHPNVGPCLARQLISKLVTGNPSAAYIGRIARVFNDNGSGVRGDLQALVRAVLLDRDARAPSTDQSAKGGMPRDPAIRFATFLRALGAHSIETSSPMADHSNPAELRHHTALAAPSVFNFFSTPQRPADAVAATDVLPTTNPLDHEAAVVGSLRYFSSLIKNEGYRWGSCRLSLNLKPLVSLAAMPAMLVDRLDALLFACQMAANTRQRLVQMLGTMPQKSEWNLKKRVQAALMVIALSPDFVVQK